MLNLFPGYHLKTARRPFQASEPFSIFYLRRVRLRVSLTCVSPLETIYVANFYLTTSSPTGPIYSGMGEGTIASL